MSVAPLADALRVAQAPSRPSSSVSRCMLPGKLKKQQAQQCCNYAGMRSCARTMHLASLHAHDSQEDTACSSQDHTQA